MDKAEQIWIASVAVGKKLDYETLYYSDYMNGNEEYTESVYEYVVECENIGRIAFNEKYSEYDLY